LGSRQLQQDVTKGTVIGIADTIDDLIPKVEKRLQISALRGAPPRQALRSHRRARMRPPSTT